MKYANSNILMLNHNQLNMLKYDFLSQLFWCWLQHTVSLHIHYLPPLSLHPLCPPLLIRPPLHVQPPLCLCLPFTSAPSPPPSPLCNEWGRSFRWTEVGLRRSGGGSKGWKGKAEIWPEEIQSDGWPKNGARREWEEENRRRDDGELSFHFPSVWPFWWWRPLLTQYPRLLFLFDILCLAL